MPAITALSRSQIVSALQGQSFTLPEFASLYHGWTTAASPHLEWLRSETSSRIRFIVTNRKGLKAPDYVVTKFEAADFGLFAALWWPSASKEFLLLEIYALIWIFMWDDEIDSEDAHLGSDLERAHSYREETLRFVKSSLGLMENDENCLRSENILISSFSDIANFLRHEDRQRRARLYMEIETFIYATEIEQNRRKIDITLPSFEDYLECRMGTSGVGTICFALLHTPITILQDRLLSPEIDLLEREVNINISIINDILSLQKELEAGTPDSIIPIIWQATGNVQQAVDKAMELLTESRRRFDEAEAKLRSKCSCEQIPAIEDFLEACRTNCTGNVTWSMESKRYNMHRIYLEQNNTVVL